MEWFLLKYLISLTLTDPENSCEKWEREAEKNRVIITGIFWHSCRMPEHSYDISIWSVDTVLEVCAKGLIYKSFRKTRYLFFMQHTRTHFGGCKIRKLGDLKNPFFGTHKRTIYRLICHIHVTAVWIFAKNTRHICFQHNLPIYHIYRPNGGQKTLHGALIDDFFVHEWKFWRSFLIYLGIARLMTWDWRWKFFSVMFSRIYIMYTLIQSQKSQNRNFEHGNAIYRFEAMRVLTTMHHSWNGHWRMIKRRSHFLFRGLIDFAKW